MLFRRGKRGLWWFQFVYRGRRYRESTGTPSETLAGKIERKRRREIEESTHGIRRPSTPVLFSVAAADWLELKRPTWANKTSVIAKTDVEHLKVRFGRLLLTDVTDKDIADYITSRRTERAADKTIRNELGTFRGILKRHKLWAQLKDEGVRLPSGRQDDIGCALTLEEEARLLAACAASRSRSLLPAVTLALCTGLRLSELRLLRWKQVDLVNEALRVGRSKTVTGAGRAVHLNQRALAAVRDWAQQFPTHKPSHCVFPSELVGFSGHEEIPQVFHTDPTKPITSWKVAWTSARKAAGVQCRFHDLRHTTVTRLLERGVFFAVVATIMGWSPGTTMRMAKRYSHIGESAQRQAMAALDSQPTQLQTHSAAPAVVNAPTVQ